MNTKWVAGPFDRHARPCCRTVELFSHYKIVVDMRLIAHYINTTAARRRSNQPESNMHNPDQMEIVMKLATMDSGKTFWYYQVIQRGEVVKCFLTIEEAAAYI